MLLISLDVDIGREPILTGNPASTSRPAFQRRPTAVCRDTVLNVATRVARSRIMASRAKHPVTEHWDSRVAKSSSVVVDASKAELSRELRDVAHHEQICEQARRWDGSFQIVRPLRLMEAG